MNEWRLFFRVLVQLHVCMLLLLIKLYRKKTIF